MSVKSPPIRNKYRRKHGPEASSDGDVVIPLQFRRGSRSKMANTRSDLEGERAEWARAMFKSRAGYIGAQTKLRAREHRRAYGKLWNTGRLEVQAEIA